MSEHRTLQRVAGPKFVGDNVTAAHCPSSGMTVIADIADGRLLRPNNNSQNKINNDLTVHDLSKCLLVVSQFEIECCCLADNWCVYTHFSLTLY